MDIEQLRQICTAAQRGTFAQAAHELHVSQSTLTRNVQRVEAHLGAALFDRNGRHVTLNALGQQLIPHMEHILHEADVMARIAYEASCGLEHLSIEACSRGPMWTLVPRISAQYPNLQLTTESGVRNEQIIEDVRNGVCDLGIAIIDGPDDCVSLPFMTESISVSLDRSHPLAREKALSFAQLDGETFLVQKRSGHWDDLVRRRLPHSSFQTGDDYVLMTKIMSESPLPHFATDMSFENVRHADGRVLIPINDEDAHAHFRLICLKGRRDELEPYLEIGRQLQRERLTAS